jgi:hypothetical protein
MCPLFPMAANYIYFSKTIKKMIFTKTIFSPGMRDFNI